MLMQVKRKVKSVVKKKILMLGGSTQQVIAIETAKKIGFYTVLCDYLSDNPGQYIADKFYLVSTIDKESVLRVAQYEAIDGVIAYASDPAAPTAAYVAEKLGLPGNPYECVEILCNKDLFRSFLLNSGLNAPQSCSYSCIKEIVTDAHRFSFPIIVKPVDSSGSKGATVINGFSELEEAAEFAFTFSRCHRIIIEEFIERKSPYLIGGDIFVYNGKVILWGLMNCHRDSCVNPLVPVGKSYPPMLEAADLEHVKEDLQTMVDKLHFKTGAMNIEIIIDKNGRVLPIDAGPRNGGNMIPDLLGLIFNTDVVEMTIRAAMGMPIMMPGSASSAFYATYNLHTAQTGYFEGVNYSNRIRKYIYKKYIYKKPGDKVEYFDNAGKAIGIVFMKFDDQVTMMDILEEIQNHIYVEVRLAR